MKFTTLIYILPLLSAASAAWTPFHYRRQNSEECQAVGDRCSGGYCYLLSLGSPSGPFVCRGTTDHDCREAGYECPVGEECASAGTWKGWMYHTCRPVVLGTSPSNTLSSGTGSPTPTPTTDTDDCRTSGSGCPGGQCISSNSNDPLAGYICDFTSSPSSTIANSQADTSSSFASASSTAVSGPPGCFFDSDCGPNEACLGQEYFARINLGGGTCTPYLDSSNPAASSAESPSPSPASSTAVSGPRGCQYNTDCGPYEACLGQKYVGGFNSGGGTCTPYLESSNLAASSAESPAPGPSGLGAEGVPQSPASSTFDPVSTTSTPESAGASAAPSTSDQPTQSASSISGSQSLSPSATITNPAGPSADKPDPSPSFSFTDNAPASACDLGGIYDLLRQIKAEMTVMQSDLAAIRKKVEL
jgi:hypothetical protein